VAAAALAAHQAGAKAVHMHPKAPTVSTRCIRNNVDAAVSRAAGGAGATAGRDDRVLGVARRGTRGCVQSTLDRVARLRVDQLHEPVRRTSPWLLLSKGLGVEVGIFHAERPSRGPASEIAAHCMRVMIELGPDVRRDRRRPTQPWCSAPAHGRRRCCTASTKSCWPLLEHAGACGVQTRIGMGDRCGCPTARRRRQCRAGVRRVGCSSVGAAKCEVAKSKPGITTQLTRHGCRREAGALPVPWWHDTAGVPGENIGANQMRCGSVLFRTDLQQEGPPACNATSALRTGAMRLLIGMSRNRLPTARCGAVV